jgi:hypothetical protein
LFPLERVLEVLEWSRKNLEAFLMIPQLLRQLEGNSELRKRFVRNYRHNYEGRHALTEGHTFKGSDQIDLEQGRIFQVSRVACYRVWGQSVVLDRVERVEEPRPEPLPPEMKARLDRFLKDIGKITQGSTLAVPLHVIPDDTLGDRPGLSPYEQGE